MRAVLALLVVLGITATGCTSDAASDPDEGGTLSDPLATGGVADPLSPDSLAGTFEGHYSAGFEHTGFVPCADATEAWWTEPAMTETRIAADQIQRDMRPAADIHARYAEAVGDDEGTFGHGVTVWARLRGRATPRRDGASWNGYGHEGAYTRAFAVDSVEALVRDTTVAGCPAPASVRP